MVPPLKQIRPVQSLLEADTLGDFFDQGDRRYTLVELEPKRFRQTKPEPLGAFLVRFRQERRDGRIMSQTELGKIIGYSQKQVSRLERGDIKPGADEESRIRGILQSTGLI